MGRTPKVKNGEHSPPPQMISRHWVEIRDLRDNTTRTLPLTAVGMVALTKRGGGQETRRKQVLRLKDDLDILEVKDLDDLAAQLRERYPDDGYERTLHVERNHEAEERWNNALNGLVHLIVESFVRSLPADDRAVMSGWFETRDGKKALRESWPKIVDAYFDALCNPTRGSGSTESGAGHGE